MVVASDQTLKFSEFVNLVLAQLYEWDRQKSGAFFNLNAVSKGLRQQVPQQWVFDAAKVLQARGLVQAIFAFGGFCQASLTGEGRLYVEEEQGFVKQIHESPQHYFLNVSGSNNQVVVGSNPQDVQQHMTVEESRRPAFSVLDEIEETLNKDSTLEPASKADLLADLDAVRKQLRKREPNRPALAALLQPMAQVATIAGHVATLIKLLNG